MFRLDYFLNNDRLCFWCRLLLMKGIDLNVISTLPDNPLVRNWVQPDLRSPPRWCRSCQSSQFLHPGQTSNILLKPENVLKKTEWLNWFKVQTCLNKHVMPFFITIWCFFENNIFNLFSNFLKFLSLFSNTICFKESMFQSSWSKCPPTFFQQN